MIMYVSMQLISSVFAHNGRIPSTYTCDGENVSPPLRIENAPEATKSFVLIVDDPDVPAQVRPEQMWDHWIVFNIPGSTTDIAENTQPGTAGQGSYPHMSYGGPCPPAQYEPTEHRYFFKLYALDTTLDLPEGATKAEVEAAMEGHIIEQTELIGRYERQ